MANISYGVNLLPKTNNAYTLGNSDYKWSNIYTVQLNGINVEDLGTSDLATTTTPGLMSAADKAKLDTLSAFNATDYTVNIATTDWVNNSYTWTNAAVTATSYIIVNFTSSVNDYVRGMLDYTKVSSGIQFNVESTPTGTITLIVGIIDGASGTSVSGGGADIDDTTTAQNKTWSSQKIDEQVIISSTQPSATSNKLWISNDSGTEVSVPTYAEFEALSGSAVTDVQVNGTSVVSSGTANIPVAETDTFGVVKVAGGVHGVELTSSGKLRVVYAPSPEIKSASESAYYKPITPPKQHEATFFGLAKAAGDSTQSASSNVVGIYTDEAKIAIQKMLGIYEPPYELVNDITLESATNFELTTTDNNIAYNFRNIFISVDYPENLTTVSSGYARYKFYDSNNSANITAETGRYNTSTNKKYKYIYVKRESNFTVAYFTAQENTGSAGYWRTKSFGNGGGISTNLGNITKITMPEADSEPIGTRIRVYAQWAY